MNNSSLIVRSARTSLLAAQALLAFFAVDEARALNPVGINPQKSTFISETGSRLRGARVSLDLCQVPPLNGGPACAVPTQADLHTLKSYGFNAIHIYGESFTQDLPDYPVSGCSVSGTPPQKRPGANEPNITQTINYATNEGLYVVLTIGNGDCNGNYNAQFVHDFWNYYAPLYASKPNVLFEVQNEPVFGTVDDSNLIAMEADAYKVIRRYSSSVPVLFFTFNVLDNTNNIRNNIQALYAEASAIGAPINWNCSGIAYHGYAGAQTTKMVQDSLVNNGMPLMNTEFDTGPPNFDYQDAQETADLEAAKISWMTFLDFKGVLDDAKYKQPLQSYGVQWVPLAGSFPVAAASIPDKTYVTLQTAVNNLYISATQGANGYNGTGYLSPSRANAQITSPGSWELLYVSSLGYGMIAFQGDVNNQYISADRNVSGTPLWPSRTQLGIWEKFYLELEPNGYVTLFSLEDNQYVSANTASTNILSPTTPSTLPTYPDRSQNSQNLFLMTSH